MELYTISKKNILLYYTSSFSLYTELSEIQENQDQDKQYL